MAATDVKARGDLGALNGHVEDQPLTITIVGAGIGGLSAAIGLRRNGHNVTIYEQSRFASETGAAIHLCPNSNGLLRHLGVLPETFGAVTMESMVEYTEKGVPTRQVDLVEPNKIWQHPWQLAHRARLHDSLKHAALSEELPGPPVKLHTSSRVSEVDPATATITLEGGTTITADVVIGADGIYSKTRTSILGRQSRIFSSGKAAFRFLIPRSVVLKDPETARVFEQENELYIWYAEDRRVVVYPCDNNELLNFVCIHPEGESQGSTREWDKNATIQQLLDVYPTFDARLLAVFRKVDPATLKVWKLLDMEQMPTWINQKLVLLGDAAHPFLPHQGQGGGVAIEDAVALMAVLPFGTRPGDVAERLQLYETIRYDRGSAIQEYSRQAGRDLKDGKQQIDMMKYLAYNFGHDEWHHSTHVFREWQRAKDPKSSVTGPQLLYSTAPPPSGDIGFPAPSRDQKFTTVSVTVKSSRTFLKYHFPTEDFSFKGPGTVARVTFAATTVENVRSLAGGAFTYFGVYIHDVQYHNSGAGDAGDDSPRVEGSFLPLLFEDIPDSTITRRPEFGMNTLQCSFKSEQSGSNFRFSASWNGTEFAQMSLAGLREVQADEDATPINIPGSMDQRLLIYKTNPLSGFGPAPHDSAGGIPFSLQSGIAHGLSVAPATSQVGKASESTIKFHRTTQATLPTLHAYISTLADIPIYEVLEAKVVRGVGLAAGCIIHQL